MLVGWLRDGRVTGLFADMVAGGRGASQRCQPDGRRSRFDPCMHGWFGVGRLACGLFTVKRRLQLRCGRCMVVLAASWSARSAWVSLRRCRWSYCRMLFVRPTRPCQRWPVASWLVQGWRSAVCQRWLAASVMVELRCSVVSPGMVAGGVAHHGAAFPLDAVPVSTRARLAGLVLAGLRVVCLRSCGGCSCGVVGARLSWPPHGRLSSCGFRRAAADGLIVKSCSCSRHVRAGAG